MATANKLRELRLARRLSQIELAQRAGISRQALGAIESGLYEPGVGPALRLARALDTTVEELFGGEHPGVSLTLEASLLDPRSGRPRVGQALPLVRVGNRLVAVNMPQVSLALVPPTGAITSARAGSSRVRVETVLGEAELGAALLIAGCDPAISVLADFLSRRGTGVALLAVERPSMEALRALKAGTVHAAGIHLRAAEGPLRKSVARAGAHEPARDAGRRGGTAPKPDKEHDSAASESFNVNLVRRLMKAHSATVFNFARWEVGLMVMRSGISGVRSLSDLVERPEVRIALKGPGSGARQALEESLRASGIEPATVLPRCRQFGSHLESARAVAAGEVECGVAPRIAAEVFGLKFLPLREEWYDFAIHRSMLSTEPVRILMDALNSSRLASEISQLCGYDTSQMGAIRMAE